MKKLYEQPEFDILSFSFEDILDGETSATGPSSVEETVEVSGDDVGDW